MKTALSFLVGGVLGFLVGETISFYKRFDKDYEFDLEDYS